MSAHPDPAVRSVFDAWSVRRQRAVIFDFNGTLSDDEPLLLKIYEELFREHLQWSLTPADYYARLAGRSDREIVALVLAEHPDTDPELMPLLLRQRQKRYRELVQQRSPIAAETAQLVHLLADRGVPMAVVTGAQRADVNYVLAHSAVAGHFTVVVTEEDVRSGKPDPEGFLVGATALGVTPADVLAFEDSLPGVAAARAAGMRCIAVEGTHDRATLLAAADAVVPALTASLFSD